MIFPNLSQFYVFEKKSVGLATKIILNNMETIEYICLDRHTVAIIDEHFWLVLMKVKLVLITDIEQKLTKANAQDYINCWKEVCPVGRVYHCPFFLNAANLLNSYGKRWHSIVSDKWF